MCLESKKESKKESCWCLFGMSVKTQKPGLNKNMHRDSYGRLAIDSKSGDNASLGWNDYMKMADFIGPDLGFLVNDTAVFQASFQILKESSDFTKNVGRSLGERSMGTEKKSDEYIGKFTWRIDDFTRLRDLCRNRGLYVLSVKSKRFQIGDRDCRLIVYLYPRGSQTPYYLSLFLEVTDSQITASDCSCFVSYRLSVVNQCREDKTIVKESQNRYSKAAKAWGWVNFMTFNSLLEKGAGFLVDGGVVFSAEVLILKETSEFSDLVEEFKFNPNAKSFIPLQTPLRSLTPVSDGSACLPMGVGIGTSFAGPRPVMYYPVQGLCTPGYMVWPDDYEPDLAEANANIQGLNEDILKIQKELDSKNSYISDQNMKINALVAEKDDITRRAESLEKDYNDLKTSSEKKAASYAELLAQREQKINELDEKLGIALSEARNNQQLVSELTQERDDLKERLTIETLVNNLRTQLHISEEALKSSRSEASNLSEELAQSIRSCEELALDVSRIQAEFEEAQESFKKSMEKERSKSEILSNEIGLAKKVLQKTREEFRVVSDDLAAMIATRNSLKKELIDVLEASLKQISSDKEARQRASNLQAEKDMLFNSLPQQRHLTNEARENIEDAHNLIMKLGREKESLEKKANKLDDELGSAKGEILRLRSRINSSSKSRK